MLVIVNPHATGAPRDSLGAVMRTLERRYQTRVVETEAPGHAVAIAGDALHEGFDAVAAFGGDGTVNEAANGLAAGADRDPGVALACLPAGQANVFAKMLGIPTNALGAAEQLARLAERWRARRVDLGVVNERCFTFSSGLGVDAIVTRQVDANPRLKARFGPWYYSWALACTLARRYLLRPPRMAVGVDGAAQAQALRGVMTVVQNGSPYTFFRDHPIEIADASELDSGKLAGCVLRRARPVDLPFLAFRALSASARVSAHRQVSAFSDVTELTVRSADERPLPLHVDGDYLGEVSEARYSVLPHALSVLA
jgi:diacylglycerol kinase family enzyme